MLWVIGPIIVGLIFFFMLESKIKRTAGLALVCLGIIIGIMKFVAVISVYVWIVLALGGLAVYYWKANYRISSKSIRRM
jgi:hypothetical protein